MSLHPLNAIETFRLRVPKIFVPKDFAPNKRLQAPKLEIDIMI
jgi:hypothetical protein